MHAFHGDVKLKPRHWESKYDTTRENDGGRQRITSNKAGHFTTSRCVASLSVALWNHPFTTKAFAFWSIVAAIHWRLESLGGPFLKSLPSNHGGLNASDWPWHLQAHPHVHPTKVSISKSRCVGKLGWSPARNQGKPSFGKADILAARATIFSKMYKHSCSQAQGCIPSHTCAQSWYVAQVTLSSDFSIMLHNMGHHLCRWAWCQCATCPSTDCGLAEVCMSVWILWRRRKANDAACPTVRGTTFDYCYAQ